MTPDLSQYSHIDSKYILLSFHYALLLIKLYSVYFIANQMLFVRTPNEKNFMFVFKPMELLLLILSVIMAISELYFISYFFVYDTIFIYEYLAIQDEIVFTFFTMYYLSKGGQHGKH